MGHEHLSGGITLSDWLGIYGALLSTIIALVASISFFARRRKKIQERAKFQTDLYFLRKIDRSTKEIHPIVVVLLANLGNERISLKNLECEGIAENSLKTTGCMGWYEQPEELFGIRKRLLPLVLERGQTADLPMIEISTINTKNKEVKILFNCLRGKSLLFKGEGY